jgi:outer membrane protein assembly factor BamB
MVYVTAFNNTYALDAATGKLAWIFETNGVLYSSPAVANGLVYVDSYDHNIYAIGSSTPTTTLTPTPAFTPVPTPEPTSTPSSTIAPAAQPNYTAYIIVAVVVIVAVAVAIGVLLSKRHK